LVVAVWIDTEECIGCGACVPTCPQEAITMDDDDVIAHLDEERCDECLECTEICPVDAIAPLGEDGQPVKKPRPMPRHEAPPADGAPRWQAGTSFQQRPEDAGCGADEPFSLLSWRPGRGKLRRRIRNRLRGGR